MIIQSTLYYNYTSQAKKIQKLAYVKDVHLCFFYLAVNKPTTAKTQTLFQ